MVWTKYNRSTDRIFFTDLSGVRDRFFLGHPNIFSVRIWNLQLVHIPRVGVDYDLRRDSTSVVGRIFEWSDCRVLNLDGLFEGVTQFHTVLGFNLLPDFAIQNLVMMSSRREPRQ